MKKKRKIDTKSSLLLLVSVLSTVILAEVSLAALDALHFFPSIFEKVADFDPAWDTRKVTGLYYAHPYTSYAMKPHYKTADNRVNINSLGFRGKEFARDKPGDVYRIVALGASTTYGIGLPDRSTYPYLLGIELQKSLKTKKRAEVINAGLVSATSAESLHRFFSDILPINPDMVVIYHGYNDLVPRMFSDFSDDYYHFRKIPAARNHLLDNFYLYRFWLRALSPQSFSDNVNLLSYTWKFDNLPDDDHEKISNSEKTSTAIFERNLNYIIEMAQKKDIQVVLATFAINVDLPNWNPYMPEVLWARGVAENNLVIRKLASNHNLPLIDFYSYALNDRKLFGDSIHMNEYGAAKKAKFFAQSILPVVENDPKPDNF